MKTIDAWRNRRNIRRIEREIARQSGLLTQVSNDFAKIHRGDMTDARHILDRIAEIRKNESLITEQQAKLWEESYELQFGEQYNLNR